MNYDHLSDWEQEEYILEQQTPRMLRHLSGCAQCRESIARLEQTIAAFRSTASQWSEACLSQRSRSPLLPASSRPSSPWIPGPRWAFAALIPVLLLILILVPFHFTRPSQSRPEMSDDALLEQVDEQVSTAVPSSMEPLTHLVKASAQAR
jgi:hypothetical protein